MHIRIICHKIPHIEDYFPFLKNRASPFKVSIYLGTSPGYNNPSPPLLPCLQLQNSSTLVLSPNPALKIPAPVLQNQASLPCMKVSRVCVCVCVGLLGKSAQIPWRQRRRGAPGIVSPPPPRLPPLPPALAPTGSAALARDPPQLTTQPNPTHYFAKVSGMTATRALPLLYLV